MAQPPGMRIVDAASGKQQAFFPSYRREMPGNAEGKVTPVTNRLVTFGHFNELLAWDLNLIRRRLREFGLDWESPQTSSQEIELTNSSERLELEVDWGGQRRRFLRRAVEAHAAGSRAPGRVLEALTERLETAPTDIDLLVERGRLYMRYLYDEQAAREDLDRALQLVPDDPEAKALMNQLEAKE